MKEFTLTAYKKILSAVKDAFKDANPCFSEIINSPELNRYLLIRHDVDRDPEAASRMAEIEAKMGICSSYYFRKMGGGFPSNQIRKIKELGHETGYHYESLSKSHGDYQLALKDFEKNLNKLRSITSVKTISMHGSPLSRFNNLDLWRPVERRSLFRDWELLGDIVLDIDYSETAYISDTGRKWNATSENLRDRVPSSLKLNVHGTEELIELIRCGQYKKIVLQIHPERWHENQVYWFTQLIMDNGANTIKKIIRKIYQH